MNSNRNSRNIRLSGLKYYFQHQHNIISHWHFDYIIVLQCGNFSHTFLTQCENFSNNFPTQCGNLLFPNSNINFKSQDTRLILIYYLINSIRNTKYHSPDNIDYFTCWRFYRKTIIDVLAPYYWLFYSLKRAGGPLGPQPSSARPS